MDWNQGSFTEADAERHADMLLGRVRKNRRKLAKAFERRAIGAYRLYDWDIPEVRAVVDWYEGHLVVAEYERQQTQMVWDYPGVLGRVLAEGLSIADSHLHIKSRRTRSSTGGQRYERLAQKEERMKVREGNLNFWVNLDDYLDTGLFPDHRETRAMVRDLSAGRRVLNLFAYTGSFTCYAIDGGAGATLSVDLSGRYLEWALDNLTLNNQRATHHQVMRTDVGSFMEEARRDRETFDLIVVDPPSFSSEYGEGGNFDIQRDHVQLLEQAAALCSNGGQILFSSNHQRFVPRLEELDFAEVEEITEKTIPIDYRNRQVHRAFLLKP